MATTVVGGVVLLLARSFFGRHLFVLALVLGLVAWLFADVLLGGGVFLYRDAAHFYYPLFQFIADEWAAGRVPLWNPYENLGMPLAANPAASVFYPGKLIFALPIGYAWAYNIYILAHLLLAAAAAYRLARYWHASVWAAGICALSYAFSGNVLFDYSNVVFLVGAAWLPLAMLAADRMLVRGDQGAGARGQGNVRWAVAFGVVLAMMVLGGDPQMAYNAGLLAAMYAVWIWHDESPLSLWERVRVRASRSHADLAAPEKKACPCPHPNPLPEGEGTSPHPNPLPEGEGTSARAARSRPVLLAVAALVGLALSAVQVLPSMEFTRLSGRSPEPLGQRLLGRTEPGTHAEHTYHFSVGPWRLAEYVWPNFSGRQFPIHRRWIDVIPAEQGGSVWTPSFYMGLLPLLAALAAMRFRRGKRAESSPSSSTTLDRWLSWTAILAVLASFGWFGLAWLIDEIYYLAGGDPAGLGLVGAPAGGVYWLMTVVLPGYASFRYPAKLLVVAALVLSVLAARGFDRLVADPSVRFRRGLVWLGGASLCAAAVVWATAPIWGDWLQAVRPDPLFGPFDATGAAHDLTGSLLQTGVLCGLVWALLAMRRGRGVLLPGALLLLTAVDLAVANRWMIVCGPVTERQTTGQAMSKLADVVLREEAQGDGQPYRVLRFPIWIPPARPLPLPGLPRDATRRMAETAQWDRDTLWPKYNLPQRIPLAMVPGTMTPRDYETFVAVGLGLAVGPERSPIRCVPFRLAEYVILPGRSVLPEAERLWTDVPGVSLWRNPRPLPRAWIVHEIEILSPLDTSDPTRLWQRTAEALAPEGRLRDLGRSAVVETDLTPAGSEPPTLKPTTSPPSATGESCRVVTCDPLRVEVEAELSRPGLVVLGDQFYPGWELEVHTPNAPARAAPILRTDRVMRGVWLPEGRHRLVYRYRPRSLAWGAAISGMAWPALALLGLYQWRRARAAR